jgi:hypothetical protein
MEKSAVEWYIKKIKEARQMCDDTSMEMDIRHTLDVLIGKGEQAKEMEKEQRGYSEEDVRLAYFQGEKDSYIKGGQTKEMENEFIQSLKQKHELNKSDILLCGEFIQDPTTTYSKCMCGRYFWEHPTKKSNL